MGKALKAVGTAIMIVGAAVATGGMALAMGAGVGVLGSASLATSAVLSVGGFSMSAGALLSVGGLVSSVGGSLTQPRVSNAGGALGWVGDPNGPMHFAAGRIAVGGDLRHKAAYGPNDRMFFSAVTVVSDAGPIDAFEGFTANDVPVTFGADGKANSSFYGGKLWRRTQRGMQPEASYLASPSGLEGGATLPNWGPQHKLSAKAATILTMVENSKGSAYKGQQPRPREIIRGLLVYDWRRDSTYPGGAGPQRLNEPSTWAYSANPILWSVKWLLGLWEGPTGKGAPQVDYQVGGIGTQWENIDVPAFTEAANIADTHGWTCAAWPSTDDDKSQVLDAFLQAGGAYYIERAGKASCIHRAAPRVSVATISAADTAGPIELDTSASYLDRKNTGVATYLSEADGWKMTALPQVSSPQWVTEDGGRQRTVPVTYPYVDKPKQAAELVYLSIAHTREGISGRIPLKSYMQGIVPGSAFTINEPEFVLDGLKCLCLEANYDAMTGVHTVTFVSETDAKYPYAYGQAPNPPAPPALTPVDPTHVTGPLPGDWTITPRPPGESGVQVPIIDIIGEVSNATATAVHFEWWVVPYGVDPNVPPPADAAWQSAGIWPPTVTSITVQADPGAVIWIAASYLRGENFSERKLYGPITVPGLIAGNVIPTAPTIVGLQGQINAAFGDIFDVSELLADARTQLDAQDAEIAAARGGEANLSARISGVNQARIDGDQANATAISSVAARTTNTEADIIDLENALANEATARAEAVSQIAARLAGVPNMLPNSTAGIDLTGWYPSSWSRGFDPAQGSFFFCDTAGDHFNVSQSVAATAGQTYTISFNSDTGGGTGAVYAAAYSGDVLIQDGLGILIYASTDWSVRHVCPSFVLPEGATSYRVVMQKAASAPYNAVKEVMANFGPARDWRDDATQRAVEASVTEQSLAIIDLENQQALASFRKIADASGAAPAYYEFVSSTSGGYAAIAAPVVALLNTTPDGQPLVAMEAEDGRVRFAEPVSVIKDGRRATLGPGFGSAGDLLLWSGPTTVGYGAETVDNGILGISATDGFFGGKTLSGPFDTGAPSATPINLTKNTWTTIASVERGMQDQGYLMTRAAFDLFLNGASGEEDDYGFLFRLAVTDSNGANLVVVGANFGSIPPNVWQSIGGLQGILIEGAVNLMARGTKRILLQVNPTGENITTAQARNGRTRGLYGA